ncbi:MAG: hypothetical protein HGB23_02640 [Chlorobiaceae bacterium]|nr:hypothetical protein [Chlorobiaceae bacterium]
MSPILLFIFRKRIGTPFKFQVSALIGENRNYLYPSGLKVSDKEFEKTRITRHKFHDEWNYRTEPRDV